MYKIYHNPRCSKSRQTLQLLEEHTTDFEIIEYLKDVPSKEEISDILTKLNLKPIDIIRKGEADFKDNFKGKTLTNEEWINAMVEFPKLIERPIVVHNDKAIVGRPPENINELF